MTSNEWKTGTKGFRAPEVVLGSATQDR